MLEGYRKMPVREKGLPEGISPLVMEIKSDGMTAQELEASLAQARRTRRFLQMSDDDFAAKMMAMNAGSLIGEEAENCDAGKVNISFEKAEVARSQLLDHLLGRKQLDKRTVAKLRVDYESFYGKDSSDGIVLDAFPDKTQEISFEVRRALRAIKNLDGLTDKTPIIVGMCRKYIDDVWGLGSQKKDLAGTNPLEEASGF